MIRNQETFQQREREHHRRALRALSTKKNRQQLEEILRAGATLKSPLPRPQPVSLDRLIHRHN